MAKRNSGGRARSRKRRPAGRGASAPQALGERVASGSAQAGRRARPRGASARAGASTAFKDSQALGERPQAPWHPLPLAEGLILVGVIGLVVGLSRTTPTTALAGVAAVLLGTAEVSWREHRSGFRAHTLLLALLPTVVFHTVVILLLGAFINVPRAINFGLLPVDVALAFFLFRLLRARFQDARRERRFAGVL
jgi:hypothetical protein